MDLEKRRVILEDRVISMVADLPSTRLLPQQTISASLQLPDGSQRKPARIGFWTEIALSLLLPDRNSLDLSDKEYVPGHYKKSSQAFALSEFLGSPVPLSLMESKKVKQQNNQCYAIAFFRYPS